MGYDLHISRAINWSDSEWFPITRAEVLALIKRHDDLTEVPPVRDPPSDMEPGILFLCWGQPDDWLLFGGGEIKTKYPRPELVRRMVELAVDLDAWLTGDDGEVYTWDGREVVQRYREPAEYRVGRCIITRAKGTTSSGEAPILHDEWMALAAAQPDFDIGTSIEASLPSGPARIACPPVAHWMDHPSGQPLPFFPEWGEVVTHDRDPATIRRADSLATILGAIVVDDPPLDG